MRDKNSCCKSCSVTDILESIALEEAGIAHILNAEGEKIQKALESDISFEEIIKLNKAVACVVNDITNLEITLSNKIKALACLQSCNTNDCCLSVLVCNCETKVQINDAIVKICKNNDIVKSGITDCNGIFCARDLNKTCYTVYVKIGSEEKWQSVDLRCCDSSESLKFCFSDDDCSC